MNLGCPTCKRMLELPENCGGKQVRCPACQAVFLVVIPTAPTQAAPSWPAVPPAPVNVPVPPSMPTAPAPVHEDPFGDLAGTGAIRSELDLGEGQPGDFAAFIEDNRQGKEIQRRVDAGVWGLRVASALISAKLLVVWGYAIFISVGLRTFWPYAFALLATMVVMPFIVVVFLGSNSLKQFRAYGLVMTACVFCFIAGVPYVLGVLYLLATGVLRFNACVLSSALFPALGAFFTIYGGYLAARALAFGPIVERYRMPLRR